MRAENKDQTIRIERLIARLNVGGPAIHTILLTRRLRDLGYSTELVTGIEGPNEGNMLDLAREQGVTPLVYPALGRELNPKGDFRMVMELYRRFRQTRPHIVHTHTAKAGAVGRLAAWMARVPIRIHTFHGHVFHGYFSAAKTRFFTELEKRLARITSRIIVLGPSQQADIQGLGIGKPGQFVQIPLGLDLARFTECNREESSLRHELGLGADTPVVSIVARLVPIKNHTLFFQAARLVLERHPAVRFVLAGDGPDREVLEAQSREMGLEKSVVFLGFRSDLPNIYAGSDVSVLTSKNEGMPVAIIESLSTGTPVVATGVGETSSIVEQGVSGYIVPPGDTAALADRICAVLEQPDDWRLKLQRTREAFAGNYSIDRLVSDIDSLYRTLLVEAGILGK